MAIGGSSGASGAGASGGSSGGSGSPGASAAPRTNVAAPAAPATRQAAAPQQVGINPRAGHPGSTHSGSESGRNSGLVFGNNKELGGWETKPNDIMGMRQTKAGSSLANEKKDDIKGIKIEKPVETRSAFDYMQPGQTMEKSPESDAKPQHASGDDEQKLPGGHDPSLTTEQLAGMLSGRRALLQAVHKYGRVGLDGTPYYVQLQDLNKSLGLGENDMDGYSIGGGE